MSEHDFEQEVAALIARGMGRAEAEAQVGFDAVGGDVHVIGEDGISRPRRGRSSMADAAMAALRRELPTRPVTVEIAEVSPAGRTGDE